MNEPEYQHWNRIYWLVIFWTTLLIVSLWLFSRQFK